MIYKMIHDGVNIVDITKYLKKYHGATQKITYAIKLIAQKYFDQKMPNRNKVLKGTIKVSRYEILKCITSIKTPKNPKIEKVLPYLKEKYPILNKIEMSFHNLSNILKGNCENDIDLYIKEYEGCNEFIGGFAKALKLDIKAIKAGIRTKVNSGIVEGGNNLFKLVKRTGFGKMKNDMLARRVLLRRKIFSML